MSGRRTGPARAGAPALAALAVVVVVAAPPGGPVDAALAGAVARPVAGGPPPEAAPFGAGPVSLDGPCRTTAATTRPAGVAVPALAGTDLGALWRHGRGAGQTVAVIDTGVNPGPRLPRVRGAGDYVADKQGADDCDAHGTLVAGIIAATGDEGGLTGLAPDVEIVSVRQTSGVFSLRDTHPGAEGEVTVGGGVGTLSTLARAVRAAADSGARVINISEVACVPAGTVLADGPLGAAVRHAALERDAVLVAAAGNVGTGCSAQNPDRPDPAVPGDDGWGAVRTVATPAWYDDLVLAVGATDGRGDPADFSLRGPWVDVAAPGTDIVSVGADGAGFSDRVVQPDGTQLPLAGTSFAAPYVSAVAALVRQAHPEFTARQVIARIEETALPAAGGRDFAVGHGVVDPVAAVDSVSPAPLPEPASRRLAAPAPAPAPDRRGRTTALVFVALSVLAVGGVAVRRRIAAGPRGAR